MSINADSLSDGTAVYISNQGNGLSGGSLLHLSTNAVGSNNGVVRLDGNEITSGKAAVINTQKLTTGKALEISTNEDLTSGKLLDVSTSSTQAYNPVAISGKRMTTGKIVQISGDNDVKISMTFTAPNCPVAESLPVEIKEKVEKINGVNKATIDVTWEPPWDKSMMSEEAKLELGFL